MTKIMGHRGAKAERPENTMAAFKRAEKLGADGIETDVHLLFDGTIPIYHDKNIPESGNSIYAYCKEMIDEISASRRFSDVHRDQIIPYLGELLEYIKTSRMYFNIEIKDESGFITDIAEKVCTRLQEFDVLEKCLISCFNHRTLLEVKKHCPQMCVGALYSDAYGFDVIPYCLKNGFDAVHPMFTGVTKEFVDRCHKNNIMVNVWTVNKEEDIRRMIQYGVDILITDDPALAIRVLKQMM